MLSKSTKLTLGCTHIEMLDAIAKGGADEKTLWDIVGAAFTYSKIAEILQVGEKEMTRQLELATRIVERYRDKKVIAFTGEEYQAAKRGVEVMDDLAAIVDEPTARAAAYWSEKKLASLTKR